MGHKSAKRRSYDHSQTLSNKNREQTQARKRSCSFHPSFQFHRHRITWVVEERRGQNKVKHFKINAALFLLRSEFIQVEVNMNKLLMEGFYIKTALYSKLFRVHHTVELCIKNVIKYAGTLLLLLATITRCNLKSCQI